MKACAKACKTTGVVLLLIGISSAFGYFMALYEVPQKTGELMTSFSSSPWVIFLMINVLLFVLGTFLDMAATILICTPIFLPIAMQFGMSPVQFGIVMLINCALGLNTPPVGTTQFIGCAIGGVSVGQVMRSIWPFYGALLVCLMLVTYVPAFSLWLPDLFVNAPQMSEAASASRMHERDNVAIVANDGGLPAGTVFPSGLTLVEKVPQAHKVALVDIPQGGEVRRYDVVDRLCR